MALTSSVSNVTVEPVNLYWGNQQLACVECIAGTSLGGKYFNISSPTTDFYVWYDTGASTDPAPAGKTGIEVTITTGDTAAQIATKTAAAINAAAATNKIHAAVYTLDSTVLLIQAKAMAAVNSAWADVDTTMTLTVERLGSRLAIGLSEGDVQIPFDVNMLDVVAHQTGPEIRDQIMLAANVGPISVVCKEAVKASIEEYLQVIGSEVTPSGGTAVTAVGALAGSKQFTNAFQYAKALLLHPTSKADTDLSNDMIFWKAYPKITDITHSGETDKKFTLEFSLYLDELMLNSSSKMVYGDWQQNFLKV